MERIRRRPFVPYEDAFEEFINLRKQFNELANKNVDDFKQLFKECKLAAAKENTVAMDVLAYYYKSGVKVDEEVLVPENYIRYINWELLSASRGNEFAIEKLQFLIGYACDIIMSDKDYSLIEYKNDIDETNVLYVLGKAIAKIYVREYQIYPVDLYQLDDEEAPYKKENSVNLRYNIDNIIPKVVEFLNS